MAGARLRSRGNPLPEPDRQSYRPVRAIGLLLILEVTGAAALGAYELLRLDWRGILRAQTVPPRDVVEVLAFVLFAPSTLLTLLAALSFLLLRRRGWLLAALSQGLTLAVCLFLYSVFQPTYVYPIMAFCVLTIMYLNVHDVRVVFHSERTGGRPGERP